MPRATWTWQWLFPATNRWHDADTGLERRQRLHECAVRRARIESGFTKRITYRTCRDSLATHVLERGQDIEIVQEAPRAPSRTS